MVMIRKAAIAGSFYPNDPKELEQVLKKFLSEVKEELPIPKAIIAPHAAYTYSGPVAASAYACLAKAKEKITRVVLLAPTHFYPVFGLAAPEADYFETPLGQIKIDRDSIYEVLHLPQIKILEESHKQEHSIEIQLPFLQILLKNFSLVPFVVGDATTEQVAEVLEKLW